MFRSRQTLSAAATRAALGLVLAGALAAGAHTGTASARPITPHKHQTGHYTHSNVAPADASTPVGVQPHPNHKPLSDNHSGSPTNRPNAPLVRPSGDFDWVAAGVGAVGMLGLILLLVAANAGLRTARRRSAHDTSLVLEVRDDRPSVS